MLIPVLIFSFLVSAVDPFQQSKLGMSAKDCKNWAEKWVLPLGDGGDAVSEDPINVESHKC